MIEREEITAENMGMLSLGSEVHRVKLIYKTALMKGRLKCNSEASLVIIKGNSKDIRYQWYPFWSLELYDRDGNTTITSLSKELFFSIIEEFFLHEWRVDNTRDRKSDIENYEKKLKEIVFTIQKKIHQYNIPEIYKTQKKVNQEK